MARDIREVLLRTGHLRLSGLLASCDESIATIIALPGGGMTARYFHGHLHPSLSLLQLGSRLGYTVLAMDRPGYGASADAPDSATTLTSQAEIVWSAIQNTNLIDRDQPLLLVGHSFGAMVALQMAGHNPGALEVLGVDFNGIGSRFAETVTSPTPQTDFRELHWGPTSNYPEGSFLRTNMPTARLPGVEATEAMSWQGRVGDVVAAVIVGSASHSQRAR